MHRSLSDESRPACGEPQCTPGGLLRAGEAILDAGDLQNRCRLFLEALRREAGYRRAVLTLVDDQGNDFQWFFAGYSNAEIDRMHSGRRPPRQGTPRRSDGRTGSGIVGLHGRDGTVIGRLNLEDRDVDPGDAGASDHDVGLFVQQMAHVLQIDRLEQAAAGSRDRERRLEEQLKQAEKMSTIGQLVSGVAHELSNPLSGVIGFTELLLRKTLDPKTRKHLDRIHGEAIRCQKITHNLLAYTRRHKPEMTFRGLHEVVDSVLELRAYQLQVDNIDVERRYQAKQPGTRLDFHQMEQVFLNLINNAQQAMMVVRDRPRRLVITIDEHDGRLRARVTDSGPGISADRLRRVFEPFFTTKQSGEGTGLGLSLSRAIIGNHQGKMSAESVLGEGTTITVELPTVTPRATDRVPRIPPVEARAPLRALRVLVVDDEAVLVELLADFLKHAGHSVDHTRDGHRALELATSGSYDVILSDLKMPGLDGQGLYERLCASRPEMKHRFVFSTGDLANPNVQKFFQITGCNYLVKPFKLESVLTVLEQVDRRRHAA